MRPVTDRFRVVPAAYVYLERDGAVLLQLRQNTGYRDGDWAAGAAGHVEQDESVFSAARREVIEELGVHVAPADLVPLCAMHRTHGNHLAIDERVDFFFTASRWDGEPTAREPRKVAALQWFALTDLPANVPPHERLVLEAMAGGSVPPILSFGF